MKKTKDQIKSHSGHFKNIYKKSKSGRIPTQFRVKDVDDILKTSTGFLSKHSIDPNDINKKAEGNPYFVRIQRGLYEINSEYDWIFPN